MNSSTGATAKTIDDPATGPMNPLDSLGITQIPAQDEAFRPHLRPFLPQAIKNLPPPHPPAGEGGLRPQVRSFPAQAIKDLPPHQRARSWGGHDAAFSRALGQRGWLGITLPRAYGGAGRSPFARYVLVEEFLNFGAPVGAHWIADRQSGPLILKYGTEAQKQFYLPRICRGEAFFCIGMSEPGAGSDLASVKTRVRPNAQGFLLDG